MKKTLSESLYIEFNPNYLGGKSSLLLNSNRNNSNNNNSRGFPGGAVVENLPANAGDMGSSPGLGGSHMPRSN